MSLGVGFSALCRREAAVEPTRTYLRRDEKSTLKLMLALG